MPLKGKLPEKLWEIRAKHGHSTFRKELINEVNKLGVTKKQLEDGYAYKNGFLVEKMDQVIKVLHEDHDIIMITGKEIQIVNNVLAVNNILKKYFLSILLRRLIIFF